MGNLQTQMSQQNFNRNKCETRRRKGQLSKIDIPIPEFSAEYEHNPIEFICNLEQYIDIERIAEDCESLITKRLLKGRARSWFYASVSN